VFALALAYSPAHSNQTVALQSNLDPEITIPDLEGHVSYLAGDMLEGRGPGTEGLDRAADYIADAFAEAGLSKFSSLDGFFQPFVLEVASNESPEAETLMFECRNVAGYIPGSEIKNEFVVIGAHYDHLGRGDVIPGESGSSEIHNGADDNASGVAALIEIAESMAALEEPLPRTIVFVAFSAEEAGLVGSRHFVEHSPLPLDGVIAMLNLDTVGRMEGSKLIVFGVGTAEEIPSILDAVNYPLGLELTKHSVGSGPSDQTAFYEKGIPALQFFTGAHTDYHRPTDDVGKINFQGLAQVSEYVAELARYLAYSDLALTFSKAPAPRSSPKTKRTASLGTIPDFSHEGPGLLISGVSKSSPAELAGLRKGDIVTEIGTFSIDSIYDLSAALKTYAPGDTVSVVFSRNGAEMRVQAILQLRR
jgi:hypothetical protein